MKKIMIFFIVLTHILDANDNYYFKNNQKENLTPYTSISRSTSHIDYYSTDKGITFGVTDKLIVKLKNEKSLEKCLNEFNLTVEKSLSKNLYLLKTTNKKLTIDISNRLSEKNEVEYAHPDFTKKTMSR